METDVQSIDYPTLAKSILSSQYRKPNFEAQATIVGKVFEKLQDDLFYMGMYCYLDTATGHQLDMMGSIWDVSRGSLNDVAYRKQIKVVSSLTLSGTNQEIKDNLKTKFEALYAELYPAWSSNSGITASYRINTDADLTIAELENLSASGVKPIKWQYLKQEGDTVAPITTEDGSFILIN